MKRFLALAGLVALTAGCARPKTVSGGPKPTAYGVAIVTVSGDKQVGGIGATLAQPVVVQVNDKDGNGVPGALVTISGPAGSKLTPASGLTDSSGQFSTEVRLAGLSGRQEFISATRSSAGKPLDVKTDEIALGWQENLGERLNRTWCERCHNSESTPERVSNYDNLHPKPHAFTEGDTLNRMSNADLRAIISHGGPALGNSAQMPSFGYTLSKSDIQALIAYIRAVADPPYGNAAAAFVRK
jgi:mono/diheme cytochrome c family protein